jgi:long-chain fatty acid transport protein
MKPGLRKSLLVVAITATMAAPVANATNGYFMHGYSTKEQGLGGAGAALSQDALASANNPAGMVFVGDRMDLGLQVFSPSPRKYTVTGNPPAPNGTGLENFCAGGSAAGGPYVPPCAPPFSVNPGSVESENDFFLIPHFGYNMMLDQNSAVGVSVYGNGGMDTKYTGGSATALNPNTFAIDGPFPGTYGAGTAGVHLEQLFGNFSYAYKVNDKHALGVSLILVGQRFRAQGLENFSGFSLDPNNMSGNRNSYSYGGGLKFGYQGEVSKGVRAGVSYQTKMKMGEFDKYKGLFAESGSFDIPSTYTIGISVDLGNNGTVVADVQRINYSDVASISNPISRLTDGSCMDALNATLAAGGTPTPASGAGCLGGSNGAGFGWEDMTIIKLGYQWLMGNNTYRVGYSHGDQPIPQSETLFNILAPAVIEDHLTFGMTMPMGSDQELNLAAMYGLNNSVKGANPFDGGATQIEIEMSQWDIQAGWAWKF